MIGSANAESLKEIMVPLALSLSCLFESFHQMPKGGTKFLILDVNFRFQQLNSSQFMIISSHTALLIQ